MLSKTLFIVPLALVLLLRVHSTSSTITSKVNVKNRESLPTNAVLYGRRTVYSEILMDHRGGAVDAVKKIISWHQNIPFPVIKLALQVLLKISLLKQPHQY